MIRRLLHEGPAGDYLFRDFLTPRRLPHRATFKETYYAMDHPGCR